MTDEQIIKMGAKVYLCDEEGRDDNSIIITDHLRNFAKLVAQHERENFCALLRQLHDSISLQSDPDGLKARGEA